MLAIYYETKIRDEVTGNTLFTVEPQEQAEHLENGILLCYGKIGIYKNRTPLEIEGEWNEEYFEISKCNLPKDNIRTVLSYLEVSQMNINTFERYRKGEDIITFLSSDKAKSI